MKKLIPLIAVLCLIFSSCGGDPSEDVKYTRYNSENWFNSQSAYIASENIDITIENTGNSNKTNAYNSRDTAKSADKNENNEKSENTELLEKSKPSTAGKSKNVIITPVKTKNKNKKTKEKPTKTTANKKANTSELSKSAYNSEQPFSSVKKADKNSENTSNSSEIKTNLHNSVKTDPQTEPIIQTTTLAPLSDTDICYITKTGECYHRQGCRYLSKSCIEIIVSEAKEQGKRPCSICKP